jgi:hypothetical protein
MVSIYGEYWSDEEKRVQMGIESGIRREELRIRSQELFLIWNQEREIRKNIPPGHTSSPPEN